MTLDPAQDPDRFDPARVPLDPALDPDRFEATRAAGPLDPALDPDRFDPALDAPPGEEERRRAPTLPGLLGSGAFEEERDGLTWVLGLLAVLGFLALVSVLITVVPRG